MGRIYGMRRHGEESAVGEDGVCARPRAHRAPRRWSATVVAATAAIAAMLASACLPWPRGPRAADPVPVQAPTGAAGAGRADPMPPVAADSSARPPAGRPAADSAVVAATTASAASRLSATDITREVARVFGDSAPPPPVAESAAPPGGPVWDIDVRSYETHSRVEHFVQLFSGSARSLFEKSLQRQTRYGPVIRQKLRDGGLPEDMTYLALVESWYDPNAYSRAAAVGMWQFMAGTARGVGLRVDWWVDERRDPVRSTDGAVRLLRGLREEFGSLYLAAAAYNGGDGRVSRGLARYASDLDGVEGDDRFFTLADTKYLRPETRDYVPKIIAAALVGKEPRRYGVTVDSLPPFAFDTVRVGAATSLAAIAHAAAAPLPVLRDLNPQLLRGMTPPADSFWVRVPPGSAATFAGRFAALAPDERAAVERVKSRRGETMLSIARRHHLTVKQLAWYNPKVARLKSGALRIGQTILVPSAATVVGAADVPDPSIERYPRRGRGSSRVHVVKRGETLDEIARRYGTSAASLMRLNGLRKPLIMPGQVIVVRATPVRKRVTTARKPAAAKKPAAKKKSAKSRKAVANDSGPARAKKKKTK